MNAATVASGMIHRFNVPGEQLGSGSQRNSPSEGFQCFLGEFGPYIGSWSFSTFSWSDSRIV